MEKRQRLSFEDASLQIGQHVLFQHINFTIQSGEMCGIHGESGCGKSSFIKCIMGFMPLSGGNIRVEGKLLTPYNIGVIRSRIAYLSQDIPNLDESVEETMQALFRLKANRHLPISQNQIRAEWEQLNLDPGLLKAEMYQLSGGQRQRIYMASALLLNRPILLLDEPTSALDEDNAQRVIQRLRKACDAGCAVLLVSHDPTVIRSCDKQLCLDHAKRL